LKTFSFFKRKWPGFPLSNFVGVFPDVKFDFFQKSQIWQTKNGIFGDNQVVAKIDVQRFWQKDKMFINFCKQTT